MKVRIILVFVIYLLFFGEINCSKSLLNAPELRETQSTFVQWVVSLLPQVANRPQITPSTTTEFTTITSTTSKEILNTSPTQLPTSSTAVATNAINSSSSTPTNVITMISNSTMVVPPLPPAVELNPFRNCTDCLCGIANTQKRIVGGQETEVHQYPWVAMLLYGGRFYCAGSLLNDQFLITASHCVYGFRKDRITIRLLDHDRKMAHYQKIDRKILEITTHPKYNARTYDNDIAVIKMDIPVPMNEILHPICMPTPGKSFKGETGIVTGWGALKVGGPTSDTLQEVQVPIMSQFDCRKSGYGSSRITDNMLCAGYDDGKRDSCQGDSGGPLHIVVPGTREHQLAGVVSWGEGCAKAQYPGVYARVNRYGTWIKSITKNACLCHSETKKIKKL